MGCGDSTESDDTPSDLVLDFTANHTQKSDESRKLFDEVNEQMKEGPVQLEVLQGYTGCEEPIRKALNEPGPKTEQAAWKTVSKAVDKLYEFYIFSTVLQKHWAKILDTVCQDDSVQGLRDNLAFAKQIAQIFDFVFHFDEAKMVNPAIQNDFSYYRRVLGRMKNTDKEKKNKVDEELANKMSFFFAYPTPMMKILIDSTTDMDQLSRPRLISGLALLANLACKAMDSPANDQQVTMLLLCTITGCIILVDHLQPEGAFSSKSPIRIRTCITKLKASSLSTDFLLNSLRFTTLHLNDESTMSSITKLLS
jgi:hypothetical protein